MSQSTKVIIYAIYLVVGIAVVLLGCFEVIDGYFAGIGGALAGVGGVRLIQSVRYFKDPNYARKVNNINTDERLAYIANSSGSLAMRISVIVIALLSIILRPMGYTEASRILLLVMGGEIAIYLATYYIVSRKY